MVSRHVLRNMTHKGQSAIMACIDQPAIDQDLHPERRTFAPVVLPALLSTYLSARAPYDKARFN
ncbi:hypothetical protein PSCICM_17730 [Pseudomonas cichorii]|uniref:Uncharacterized protein n=1 Tax=Pseudomonas cichorii TaxID=36746 RepID=A0ABQ1DJ51_PSECI|nr:hypothetical protein PCH70_37790 [Pseudomonas cichorii JBC1]GFM75954.1 hypothetical protein PSCICM_17730 [Pseudomonas cichorii]GFM91037.1 hypothetical protein PSCICP_10090 [Pseudomonas cichorii]